MVALRREAIYYSLRSAETFENLPEQDLRDLAEAAVLKTLDKGAYLFREGEPVAGLYLVRRGIINLHHVAMDGREVVIHFYREGETLAEASAMKLYSARAATEVALEAVQLHGGNGYMSEFHVEQLARDAKVLQIYAGTDEIQITHIAKDLLRR